MARQKEFDRDEVLHRAMEVFWMRGYEGTSIQDLVKYMGINRQSHYDTFGDKHSLFLQSLDRYREIQSRKVFDVLERPGSVKKNLRQLFEEVVTPALSAEGRRGCFVGNSMSELLQSDGQQNLQQRSLGGENIPAGLGTRERARGIVASSGYARGGAFSLLQPPRRSALQSSTSK